MQELHIDWTDFPRVLDGFIKVMLVTDCFTGLILPYFMTTSAGETENLRVLKDVAAFAHKKDFQIETIQSDNELNRNRTQR